MLSRLETLILLLRPRLVITAIRCEHGIFRIVMREGRGAVNEGFIRLTRDLILPDGVTAASHTCRAKRYSTSNDGD
jgi:hypothetical protein